MAELTQTNDFMMKQEALWGFLSKFQPREWNISAKQWYEQVMKYARDYGLDKDVSVYMIDHNSLHTEVTSHREEVERIVWSIMKKFHDDLKILDIRNDGFYCSNVKNVVTTQKGFDTLASLYSNVLDVFCGNARLMEDSLGGPRDSAYQAMRLCGMGQYEEPIETIKEDYNLQDVKKKILKVGDKPKPVESGQSGVEEEPANKSAKKSQKTTIDKAKVNLSEEDTMLSGDEKVKLAREQLYKTYFYRNEDILKKFIEESKGKNAKGVVKCYKKYTIQGKAKKFDRGDVKKMHGLLTDLGLIDTSLASFYNAQG